MILEKKCPICGKMNEFECTESEWDEYKKGGLVQNCFPHATPEQRELLMTGICPECWDRMFS